MATLGGEWLPYRHHLAANAEIVKVIRREVPERILLMDFPPQHGKSELSSNLTPAWVACNYPHYRTAVLSYEAEYAAEWGEKARDTAVRWAPYFGLELNRRRSARKNWGWAGYRNSGVVTAGVGGGVTGRGFRVVICDDTVKNSEDAQSEKKREKVVSWLKSTVLTRWHKDGVLIVLQTRWHDEDLPGWLLAKAATGEGLPVRHLHFPAIAEENDPLGRAIGEALWPEEKPLSFLLEIQRAMGDPYWWNSLYQGRPGQHERAEWPDEYFGPQIWTPRQPSICEANVIAIDPSKGQDAKHGDYQAIVRNRWAQNKFWIESLIRRVPVEEIARIVVEMSIVERPDLIYVEGNGGQYLVKTIIQQAFKDRGLPCPAIVSRDSKGNKTERIARLGPYLLDSLYRFLDTGDNRLLLRMLKEFPHGDHDDGPDALEMSTRVLCEVAALKALKVKNLDALLAERA